MRLHKFCAMFLIARVHPISEFTPLCGSCGLAICSLHLPRFACPSCSAPLLSPSEINHLLEKLDQQVEATLKQEEETRLRLEAEKRAKVGEFPSLPGGTHSSVAHHRQTAPPPNIPHKVLTLTSTSKNKKLTAKLSYPGGRPPSASRERSEHDPPSDAVQEEGVRVPRPPVDVPVFNVDSTRPWANLRAIVAGAGPVYVGGSGSGK